MFINTNISSLNTQTDAVKQTLKKFDFLSKNEFFKNSDGGSYYAYFNFKCEIDTLTQSGQITIPVSYKSSLKWTFSESDHTKNSTYHNIEGTPEWFQGLFREAERTLEKRDRLRKLMDPKEINNLDEIMERLSSGKRINSTSDDAAGLAVATRMTGILQSRNYNNNGK